MIIRLLYFLIFILLASFSYANKIEIIGLSNTSIKKEMFSHSLLEAYKNSDQQSSLIEKKRIDKDRETFGKILESKGYYDYTLSYEIKPNKDVIFSIKEGPIFTVSEINVILSQQNKDILKNYQPKLLKANMPADADKLYKIFDEYITYLKDHGYPYAMISSHEAILNKKQNTVLLILRLDTGPQLKFGDLIIREHADISKTYIQNRMPWKKGEFYSETKLNQFRNKLTQSRLFSTITINADKDHIVDGYQNILISLKEGKQKNVSVGMKYSTSEQLGTILKWSNKSYTDRADNLSTSLEIGQSKTAADIEYNYPDFLSPNQKNISALSVEKEKTKTFDTQKINFSSLLSRPITDSLSLNYGTSLTLERVTQNSQTKTLEFIGFPITLHYDTRDNILNPSNGSQIIPSITPKFGKIGSNSYLLDTELFGAHYYSIDQNENYILSGWARINSIFSDKLTSIPASQRIYMGGSGSIRGYGDQLAGHLNNLNKPLGGKSSFQYGIEPRIKFSGEWGGTIFYDAGMISNKSLFIKKEEYFQSVGFGPRYYTNFGPIRADIAIPLKRRKNNQGKWIDSPFQFYVSIGQSF